MTQICLEQKLTVTLMKMYAVLLESLATTEDSGNWSHRYRWCGGVIHGIRRY